MKTTCCALIACLCAGAVGSAAAPPEKHPAKPRSGVTPAPIKPVADPSEVSAIPVSDYLQVGRWRGDGSGTDDTGQNNGSPTDGVGYARAVVGRGFHFSGRDDAVIVKDSPSLALTHSFTVNAWICIDTFPTGDEAKGMVLFRGDDRPGLDPYTLHIGPDHRLYFHVESEKGSVEISAPISSGSFVMVTAVLDDYDGKMDLYENMILMARNLTSIRPLVLLDPMQHPAIGIGNCNALPGSGYRFPFHGTISDLRVWQRVLAPGEFQSLYSGIHAKEKRADGAN